MISEYVMFGRMPQKAEEPEAKTYADGIREAVALLNEWADEAEGNRLNADLDGFHSRADMFCRVRDAHREAAEELAKRIEAAA